MGKADGSFDLFSARKGRKVEAVLVVTQKVESGRTGKVILSVDDMD